MNQLTAEEFSKKIAICPNWADQLTEDVEITTCCNIEASPITHLSNHLYFTGRNEVGMVAGFYGCRSLKIAKGNFGGFVSFCNSAIEEIDVENLKITKLDDNGNAASFSFCDELKVATGNFPGFVNFSGSAVEKIDKLNIAKEAIGGDYKAKKSGFFKCYNLKTGPEYLLMDEWVIDYELKEAIIDRKQRRLEAERVVREIKSEPHTGVEL